MAVLVLLFVVVPIAELYVIVQTSHAIGVLNTLGLLFAVSLVGGWLVKHQGLRVWKRFNQQVSRGAVPSKEIADGVLVLLAGALLLVPGFITDVIGLLLLLPPVRAGVRAVLVRRMRKRHTIVATYSGPMPDGPSSGHPPRGVIDVGSDDDR